MKIVPAFLPAVILAACSNTKIRSQDDVPCIMDKITSFKSITRQNPPASITEYTYKGKKVYYVPSPCCDRYSDVYDVNCNLLGHPDGGYSGKGDGTLPDFKKEATNGRIIWKDDR